MSREINLYRYEYNISEDDKHFNSIKITLPSYVELVYDIEYEYYDNAWLEKFKDMINYFIYILKKISRLDFKFSKMKKRIGLYSMINLKFKHNTEKNTLIILEEYLEDHKINIIYLSSVRDREEKLKSIGI